MPHRGTFRFVISRLGEKSEVRVDGGESTPRVG